MKRIVVISDLQIPYHDRRALKNVVRFIGDFQPDLLIQIGDLNDYETPSRWNLGTKLEYAQRVKSDSEVTKREFFAPVREVYDGLFKVFEGNHDLRPRTYLSDKAPALAEFSDDVHFSKLLDFDGFGVELAEPFMKLGPGTVGIHGHEIKGMSQIAGTTAFNHATKANANVIMGHTHRLGIRRGTTGNATTGFTTRWGFEVGHLMDPSKAQYLGAGAVANWQKGFGLLYVGNQDVSPVEVDVHRDGSFVVEGERYGALRRGASGRFSAA
ncbi:metallophosphoesterase [Actinomadura oligospora]|uniref:metallophosphoesterase n=1 Tax=Actinomadura oligospora TaxID=111804 RepID=UPI00047C5DCF|nr:metallophosphoesterase [Actinomadura oligospora]